MRDLSNAVHMKVKIFSSNEPMKHTKTEDGKQLNQQIFEDEINAWLNEQPGIEVIRIEQSASGGSLANSLWMISIWYHEAVTYDAKGCRARLPPQLRFTLVSLTPRRHTFNVRRKH